MIGKDLDVAKNIKMTENLQCQLLAAVSDFFTAVQNDAQKAEKLELLAEMEILLLLLSKRHGVSREVLSQKAISKLKLGLVKEERSEWKLALSEVLSTFEV